MPVAANPIGSDDIPRHIWRLAPDLLAAHVTRNEPVVEGFGGEFQMSGPYRRPRHVRELGRILAKTISQGNGRLIINQPPQTGKSMLVSKWTPTWAHHLTEGKVRVLLGSYQANYAASWGRATKEGIDRHGDDLMLQISPTVHARAVWETTGGGGMRTSGIEGSMTGLPGDIIIIDDPFKSFKEAHSPTVRQDVWDWFWAVPMTRLQPGSTVIVVMTRWHEDDLTGRLLVSEGRDSWTRIRLPALCDDPDHDLLGRQEGQSIWPQRFNEAHYRSLERDQGAYRWAGMYQQLPAPLEGEIFKRGNWEYVDTAPAGIPLVRRWDLAASQGEGDYTAGVLMGRHPNGKVYILDIAHERLSPYGVEDLMKATAIQDAANYGRKRVKIVIEEEPGASGKRAGLNYVSQTLAGFNVRSIRTGTKKELDALPLAAQQEQHGVHLCRRYDDIDKVYVDPQWWGEFVEEAAVFPSGTHDDMVDAASKAFGDLIEMATKHHRAATATMAGQRIGAPDQPTSVRGATKPPG